MRSPPPTQEGGRGDGDHPVVGRVPREAPLARPCAKEARFEAGERGARNKPEDRGAAGGSHNFLIACGSGDEGGWRQHHSKLRATSPGEERTAAPRRVTKEEGRVGLHVGAGGGGD